jgi:hypothetical protein
MIPKENYIGFRTDLEDYFKWVTGVPATKISFTPFIFERKGKMRAVFLWRKLITLLKDHEEDTIIMQVWPGHWKCDCFIFTLSELQDYLYINKIKL